MFALRERRYQFESVGTTGNQTAGRAKAADAVSSSCVLLSSDVRSLTCMVSALLLPLAFSVGTRQHLSCRTVAWEKMFSAQADILPVDPSPQIHLQITISCQEVDVTEEVPLDTCCAPSSQAHNCCRANLPLLNGVVLRIPIGLVSGGFAHSSPMLAPFESIS